AVVGRHGAVRLDAEARGDPFGRLVRDLDDNRRSVAVAGRVYALDHVPPADPHRGVHHGSGIRTRPARRDVAAGNDPVAGAAQSPADPHPGEYDGAVAVDRSGRPCGERADAEHCGIRHRIPWSSDLALRSMSSGTRSAGLAPSYSTRHTKDASGISTPLRSASARTARVLFTPSAT